jgi:hypothetical protein
MTCSLDKSFTDSLTDSELNKTYGNGITPGLLPLSINESDRENGKLSSTAVQSIISNLKNSGVIPVLTQTNTDAFLDNQKKLIENIKSEYCFYYARYRYTLNKLFTSLRGANLKDTKESMSVLGYLGIAQGLNMKINDLIQIVNGVSAELLATSNSMETEIKDFDKNIKENQSKLAEQNKILSSGQAVTKLNKEMVKYTEEKARYTDNLLKLYSALNIIVLGLLIYVYKSVE